MKPMSELPNHLLPLRAKLDELETIVRRRFEPKGVEPATTWMERPPVREAPEPSSALPEAAALREPRQEMRGMFMKFFARLFG